MGWAGLGRVQPDDTDLAGLGQFGPNAFFSLSPWWAREAERRDNADYLGPGSWG
jgi:hypothetical protein